MYMPHTHVRSEVTMELGLSFHHYMGSEEQTQVVRCVQLLLMNLLTAPPKQTSFLNVHYNIFTKYQNYSLDFSFLGV